MIADISTVLVGAAVVSLGAHAAITAAERLSRRLGLSDEFIGMTILAIGTSLPEITTHVIGSVKILSAPERLNDFSALVVGTNIGSDIFQQNFLLGMVAIAAGLTVERKHLGKDVGGLIAAAALLLVFSLDGRVSRLEGLACVGVYGWYLSWLRKYGGAETGSQGIRGRVGWPVGPAAALLACFALMAVAADFMLEASVRLVERLPVSSSFFGVVVLGVAAAFPELMTAMIAAFRKRGAISAGILIGSNITNPLFALGAGAAISTYAVPRVVIIYDLPVKICTAVVLYLMFLRRPSLGRGGGIALVFLFFAYLYLRTVFFPADF